MTTIICFLVSCAQVCADVKQTANGNVEIGEFRVVGYNTECIDKTLNK